jgi:sec-independent protein translocase protein TatC
MLMATTPRDDDDIFADSRMSFGDHIEELRTRMFAALKGLVFCLMIGFVLDYVGVSIGVPQIGIGKPMMRLIVEPVESQARNFYFRRLEELFKKLPTEPSDPSEVKRIRDKLNSYDKDLTMLTEAELKTLLAAPRDLPVHIPIEPLKAVFGEPKNVDLTHIAVTLQVYPAHFNAFQLEGEALLASKKHVTTLSAQEALMVYFKVSLLCGVVLASPWIFFQFWAFIAAGMYPNEKAYVYKYLPFSIGLFIVGVLLCQFVVLPGAVKALFGFNNWIDADPDLRLNEWLSFAIILPLVFGISFQTPLVMFFLNRIGLFGWEDYLARWRGAIMVLAIFSAIITPTPDAVTMLYLFVPMFSLYMLGVLLCKLFPPSHEQLDDDDSEIAV